MTSRRRCSSTLRAVATAVAALAANEFSNVSLSARASPPSATSMPSVRPRKTSGTVVPSRAARPSASRHPLRPAPQARAVELRRNLAGARGHDQPVGLTQQDEQPARAQQGPPALHDQFEDALEIGLAAERPRDLHRRLELAPALLAALVQARVLDRDRRPFGQHADRLFVSLREGLAIDLVAEVQVSPRPAADHDRHAEERLHVRVSRREADRSGIARDGVDAQRPGVGDHGSEQSAPARRVADVPLLLRGEPVRHEALETPARLIEDADRGVARLGDLGRRGQHARQNGLEVEVGDDDAARVEQPSVSRDR